MNKKWKRILITLYVVALCIMLSGATFAYFLMIEVSNVSPKIETQTAMTDWLIFNMGDPINIIANEENFGPDMGDLVDSTQGTVTLRAANNSEEISYNYNILLNIVANDFEYTQDLDTPEILLQVTDPEGNNVSSIPGLEYQSVVNGAGETVRGFDITNKVGEFLIASNYPISTTREIVHTWDFEVILVNLDSDQNANTEKVLDAYLQIEKVS